ncbi:hypothetical protein ABKN59_012009 [Abortiporus biennis]
MEHTFAEPRSWQAGIGSNSGKFACVACNDYRWRRHVDARRHETTDVHRRALRHFLSNVETLAETTSSSVAGPSNIAQPDVRGPLLNVLEELSSQAEAPAPVFDEYPTQNEEVSIDWSQLDGGINGVFQVAPDVVSDMASGLAEWLASDHSTGHTSSSSSSRFSSTEDVNEDFPDDHSEEEASSRIGYGRQRPRQSRNEETDRLWYPWHDKETCVLDILRHLPRSIFSDKQMEVILWSMAILGVDDVPSVSVMKEIDATLQVLCGVDTIRYEGKLGHVYYANDLASIIAQEMSNPHVRPFLQHYPEDAGNELSECWQAQRWLREIDPSLVTPMAHIGHQDFYVFEPAMLRDGSVVVPERWFTRKQGRTQNLYARAFRTSTVISDSGNSGYIVNEFDVIEVSSRDLWLSFPQLIQTFHSDGLPDPRNIIGIMKAIGRGICPWTYTTPDEGNRWRKLAKGHRVVSFMMWLYCDDTSGNVSKKWNKHNSFLFTAAGLSSSLTQQESNVHFLATSNIAPPLEMLDGIVDQLESCQTNGIWA